MHQRAHGVRKRIAASLCMDPLIDICAIITQL